MNEWMNEWVSEWVSEWMSEWVSEWVNEWMSEWVYEWMSEWVNEWMSEWVNEWMNIIRHICKTKYILYIYICIMYVKRNANRSTYWHLSQRCPMDDKGCWKTPRITVQTTRFKQCWHHVVVVIVVGCCWLLSVVVGCWLLAVDCWLLAVGCWLLLVVGCWLLVVGCCCCCCRLLSVVVGCCRLLSVVVGCCRLLSVVVGCCRLLSVVVCCCLLLSVVVVVVAAAAAVGVVVVVVGCCCCCWCCCWWRWWCCCLVLRPRQFPGSFGRLPNHHPLLHHLWRSFGGCFYQKMHVQPLSKTALEGRCLSWVFTWNCCWPPHGMAPFCTMTWLRRTPQTMPEMPQVDQWVNHFSRTLCQYHPGRDILDTYMSKRW